MKTPVTAGARISIQSPKSQYHKRTGIVAGRSTVRGRWLVWLDGDNTDTHTEFFSDEIVVTRSYKQAAKR